MDKVFMGAILVVFHLAMAIYSSMLVKSTLKLSANAKNTLYVANFLIPLIGFAISITICRSNNKGFSTSSGYEGSYTSSDSNCDGGSGE
jgi:mannose/fructose/N-acetylgalactosamine-specific phosphotransferase system component IIC